MRIVFYVGKAQEKGEVEGAETDWKKQRERNKLCMTGMPKECGSAEASAFGTEVAGRVSKGDDLHDETAT